MQILEDEKAQGSAELLLIVGGIIVVVIVAAIMYRNYVSGLSDAISSGTDMQNVISGLDNITTSLK